MDDLVTAVILNLFAKISGMGEVHRSLQWHLDIINTVSYYPSLLDIVSLKEFVVAFE